MFRVFKALVDRVKALFLTDAALDLQAQLLTRAADRKADLLRRAAAFEAEGLSLVASELRQQAGALDLARPLAIVLPAVEYLTASDHSVPELPGPAEVPNSGNGKTSRGKRRDPGFFSSGHCY